MGMEYLDRWSAGGWLSESPAEERLALILESGPGTDARAAFAHAGGWLDALRAVAAEPDSVARRGLIVFPQVGVLGYRADFMVVCADVRAVEKSSPLSHMAFFVECDGLVGHAEDAQQILADRDRERAIRAATGMQVLRFSGAEAMYQPREVREVVAAHVEALAALRESGGAVRPEADAVLAAVAELSCHRALRTDYTARNAQRSKVEPYDPNDPAGEEDVDPAVEREAAWDSFLGLRLRVARLRHAVARVRRQAPWEEEWEAEGDLRPFRDALLSALDTIARNFEQAGREGRAKA